MKRFLELMICTIIMIICSVNVCFGSTIVTESNLKKSLEDYSKSETNKDKYIINLNNNNINIELDGKKYIVKYDLTGKPTFYYEIPISKGMSYRDYKEKTDMIFDIVSIAYMSVANIQGVKFDEAFTYFGFTSLSNLNGEYSTENSYVIVDDMNMDSGVNVNVETDDQKTIKQSEFGDRVMEFVNAMYKNKISYSDSGSEYLNTYEYTIERTDVTETSCKLISKITINTNAKFSSISNLINDSNSEQSEKKETTEDSQNSLSKENKNEVKNENIDNNKSNTNLPKTGTNDFIFIIIPISIILAVFVWIKYRKLNNYSK